MSTLSPSLIGDEKGFATRGDIPQLILRQPQYKSPEGMPFSRTCTIPTPPPTASATTSSMGACILTEESVTRQSLGSCVGLGIGPGGLQEELVEGSEG